MFVAALLIPGCSAKQSDLDKIQLQTLDGLPIDMNDFKGATQRKKCCFPFSI